MRQKRTVKLRRYRHFPKGIYDNYIISPCVDWAYENVKCTLWPVVMMGVVCFLGKDYYFRVHSFVIDHIFLEIDARGLDNFEEIELEIELRHALAYLFGYLNVKSFNFEVNYDELV